LETGVEVLSRENGRNRGQSATRTGPNWWVQRWRRWAEELQIGPQQASSPLGRIKRLEVNQGTALAQVQDRTGATCQVELHIEPWTEPEWQAVVTALGEQALYSAQLLAGELPPDLDAVLADAGAPLLPLERRQVKIQCHGAACKKAEACKHGAAVIVQLGEALADDPWLLFRMRGRDQSQLLTALRKARTNPPENNGAQAQSSRSTGNGRLRRGAADSAAEEGNLPLAAQLEQYWGNTKVLENFRPHLIEPKMDAVLLRRLGPLPFSEGDDDIYEDLAEIYRHVSREAVRRAFAAEPDEGQ
jgi:uncharacterized Zn finger protein